MVHRFVSHCQFGPGIARFQILECEVLWGGVECLVGAGSYVTGPEPLVAVPGQLCGVCSVVSYSPAPWRVQYHRRCQA